MPNNSVSFPAVTFPTCLPHQEIEVADKTTSLQYGEPAGCLVAGVLPLVAALGAVLLLLGHMVLLR